MTSTNGGQFLFNQTTPLSSGGHSSQPGKPLNYGVQPHQKTSEHHPTQLFEYQMGIRDMTVSYENYTEREAFVTKPIEVNGTLQEIELTTTENHPTYDTLSGKTAHRLTSVEYYITFQDTPSLSDWHPILPKDDKTVIGERLFLSGKQATLRFPCNPSSLRVFQNGIALTNDAFAILSNQQISLLYPIEGAIYTVDYTPNKEVKNPWVLDMNDYKSEVKRFKETFQGTSYNKSIRLSHYPFVDYEKINQTENYNPNTATYSPIKVRLRDASIAGKGNTRLQTILPYKEGADAFTYNKTLYKDKSWSELQPYNLDPDQYYGGFDYYQWKNQVVFTETFNAAQTIENNQLTHGNATVEIEYDSLVSRLRLKGILRRNTTEEITATPEVLSYTLKLKTMS